MERLFDLPKVYSYHRTWSSLLGRERLERDQQSFSSEREHGKRTRPGRIIFNTLKGYLVLLSSSIYEVTYTHMQTPKIINIDIPNRLVEITI